MKLLGIPLSPYFRKVRVVLEEKGVAYETEPLVAVVKTPELMAMNPLGKIPILVDGDRNVPDSSVICAYLERLHPKPALYPADAGDYAHALFLEEYADTLMNDVMGGIVFERYVKPTFMNQEPDEARVEELLRDGVPPILDYLESCLAGSQDTLFESFTVADASIGAALGTYARAQETIDPGRHPKLAHYAAALETRPSFVVANQE